MIVVYNSKETNFTTNGLEVLDNCIMAEVTEEKNGTYELQLEYPTYGDDKWLQLVEGNIIKAPTPKNGDQLFRIYKKVKNMTSVTCYARHIFYDLLDNFIEKLNISNQKAEDAIKSILNSASYSHSFKAASDIANAASANYSMTNIVQAIMGDSENSFLNIWGGAIERDNFSIRIFAQAEDASGITIEYGKNLQGVEEDIDISGVVTRIMPSTTDSNSNSITLPEKYVDSPNINSYPYPKINNIEYSDITSDETTTTDQIYAELRKRAANEFAVNKLDEPSVTYTVNFIELSQTEEYKDFKELEQIYICDTVTVKHENLGIDISAQVVKYVYDAILERYNEITLGNFKQDFAVSYNKEVSSIKQEVVTSRVNVSEAVSGATSWISGDKGGYVTIGKNDDGQPVELVISDDLTMKTANNIWRWNSQGLQYSNQGYTGQYNNVFTMNGDMNVNISNSSKWICDDKSYISVQNGDLTKVTSGVSQKLFKNIEINTVTIALSKDANNINSGIQKVYLPDSFKNKNFRVVPITPSTDKASGYTISCIGASIPAAEINSQEGSFNLYAWYGRKDSSQQDVYGGNLSITYIALEV
ncbi:phage tail protein [Clostridium sp. 19966]|uniref:phage tail spike protein n=1 Tax=Clostridium sp. 19966 TaxID=2768166 RepID=UPI0028DD98E0|nr:phage tail spike protein [Clostridium sp. 19966]MDT8717834.1 phage tail protein [Clostridium sp. 19966]